MKKFLKTYIINVSKFIGTKIEYNQIDWTSKRKKIMKLYLYTQRHESMLVWLSFIPWIFITFNVNDRGGWGRKSLTMLKSNKKFDIIP